MKSTESPEQPAAGGSPPPAKTFFWLHVKKSAGQSTRRLLQPHYQLTDRSKRPKNFLQADPREYNDILNNFRMVLGEYQFKRCLFAKKFLYPKTWEKLESFVFAREPIDRAISMFYYLFWSGSTSFLHRVRAIAKGYVITKKVTLNSSYAFDVFLDLVSDARVSDSIFHPINLHFTTHTAPMFEDISDENGNILVKNIYRMENLVSGINEVFYNCGIDRKVESHAKKLNTNKKRGSFVPNKAQRQKIYDIYRLDFDIYENAK